VLSADAAPEVADALDVPLFVPPFMLLALPPLLPTVLPDELPPSVFALPPDDVAIAPCVLLFEPSTDESDSL